MSKVLATDVELYRGEVDELRAMGERYADIRIRLVALRALLLDRAVMLEGAADKLSSKEGSRLTMIASANASMTADRVQNILHGKDP